MVVKPSYRPTPVTSLAVPAKYNGVELKMGAQPSPRIGALDSNRKLLDHDANQAYVDGDKRQNIGSSRGRKNALEESSPSAGKEKKRTNSGENDKILPSIFEDTKKQTKDKQLPFDGMGS